MGDATSGSGAAAAPPLLERLPRAVLASVLEAVIAGSSPTSALALALSCCAMLAAVSEASSVWRRQCAALGWGDPLAAPPAAPRHGAAAGSPAAPSGGGAALLPAGRHAAGPLHGAAPDAAFRAYSARMRARVAVRRRAKLLMQYMPRRAAAALRPGAQPARLAAAEARMGAALPWELWELLRFRDGQDAEPGAVIIDDARLLGADELFLETRELPAASLAPERPAEAAAAAAAGGLLGLSGGDGGAVGGAARGFDDGRAQLTGLSLDAHAQSHAHACAHAQVGADEPRSSSLVVFASNAGGTRMYAAALRSRRSEPAGARTVGGAAAEAEGEVYVLRGLMTARRVAGGVAAFLEHLLA